MPRVKEPTDRVFLQPQPDGKGNVGNALFPHRRIEGQLRGDDGGHGDKHLPSTIPEDWERVCLHGL